MSEEKSYDPLVNIEEILPILNKIAIFGGLNEGQLSEIVSFLGSFSESVGKNVKK
ncbi:MAG: hypothetical protein KAS66_07425 [Candidatus Omnitrophica bacterium]|nr:hypothetical protein [Candidatus Omnitrophota bacterium]